MLLKAGAAGLDEVDGALARVARSTGFSRGGLETRRPNHPGSNHPTRRGPPTMLLEHDAVGLDTPEHAQTLNHAQHSSGKPQPLYNPTRRRGVGAA